MRFRVLLALMIAGLLVAGVAPVTGGTGPAGSVVSWGSDRFGALSGTPSGADYVAVAAGGWHSLALKADGSIVGWGSNVDGFPWCPVSPPGFPDCPWWGQATPPAGNDYVAIAAGSYFGLALKSDGSIVGWGRGYCDVTTPPADTDFVAISAGHDYALALKSDGSIVGWGCNDYGQAQPPPGDNTGFVAISAYYAHSLALKSDGSIVGWGYNYSGQATPPAGNDYVAIAAGDAHSLALRSDGSIVGWGDNTWGQRTTPAGGDFVAIVGATGYSLALRADGSIVGWGYNTDGCGVPTAPPAGNGHTAIAASFCHGVALLLAVDSDNDGVPDADDAFPFSDVSPTAAIGGCDSGVANQVLPDGATFNDLISAAAANAKNHGSFVATVAKLTNNWKKEELISGADTGKIQRCAA